MALASRGLCPVLLLGVLLMSTLGCDERISHALAAPDAGVSPGACGGAPFPDLGLTGHQPTGVVLTPYSGPARITVAGTVVDGADVSTCLTIDAPNVVLKRSRVHSASRCGLAVVEVLASASGLRLEDTELDGDQAGDFGVTGGGYTALRLNVHGVNGGFAITGTAATTIQDCWVHDLSNAGTRPVDTVSSNGASHVVLRGNHLENAFNSDAVIGLFGDFAPLADFLVEHNLLNGGGFAVYAGHLPAKAYPDAVQMRFQDNCFGRKYYPQCGYFGPVSAYDATASGNVWSGNRWQDTGAEVLP
ncbi:MAG: hypothetical protein IPJ65_20160 [Archangiaceae bacterium]|nr:hypothetical protein [Archangiaceae bacterium]